MIEEEKHETNNQIVANSSAGQITEIDDEMLDMINEYKGLSVAEITERIDELELEWDIDRIMEVNAASLSLTGLLLGTFVNKKWLIMPGIVAYFLGQQALQGSCPPMELLRNMNFRARKEIEKEKFALKVARGDFRNFQQL